MFLSASRTVQQRTPILIFKDSARAVRDRQRIQSKRITRDVVEEVLKRAIPPSTLLKSHQAVPLANLPTGMKTMELKMAASGLPISDIDHLKDLKFSTEY